MVIVVTTQSTVIVMIVKRDEDPLVGVYVPLILWVPTRLGLSGATVSVCVLSFQVIQLGRVAPLALLSS